MQLVGISILALAAVVHATAQEPTPRPLNRPDLESWADSMFATYARESERPSLAIVIVRGDSVVLAKGYGYERDDGTRVSTDSSVFHIASISKLFVVTAILQLVDAGRVRLDDPVSVYLPGFGIPPAVKVRHLLTHTSGVDAPFLADVADSPQDLQPLSAYFAGHPPRFGRPPGAEIRYSNYGMALAALVAEKASGEPFDSYVERHIFAPLGMKSSSIRQPPPPRIEARVASAGSGRVPNYLLIYPAGAIVSTTSDMGRFLRFLLSGKTDNGGRMLSAEALSEMRRQQWSPRPTVPGVALGLFESDMGGRRALFHTGARVHFSLVYLLPEERVGLFIVHSMRQGGRFQSLRTNFARSFVERYFPMSVNRGANRTVPARAFSGVYRPILFSTTTLERAAQMFADTRVTARDDGSLDIRLPATAPFHVVATMPGVFTIDHGDNADLAFTFDDTSPPRRMFLSGATQDPVAFDRVRWFERGTIHLIALGIAFAIMASYDLVLLGGALVRKTMRRPRVRRPSEGGRASWPAMVASLLLLAAPLLGVATLLGSSGSSAPRHAIAGSASLLFAASVLSLATIPITVAAFRRNYWSRRRRVHHAVFAIASVVMFALVMYYHLGPFLDLMERAQFEPWANRTLTAIE